MKSWGDAWIIELLSPRTISFLLTLHLKVVDGPQLLHPTARSLKSTVERTLFPQQYLSLPGAEHLKTEDGQPPKDAGPLWNTINGGRSQGLEMNWRMGDRWADCRHNSDELLRCFSHFGAEAVQTALICLIRAEAVLIEHLPGEAPTRLQGSLRKQRRVIHGKEILCIMLYTMNFCKCYTAPAEEAVHGLSVHQEEIWKKLWKAMGDVFIASCKKHLYNMKKTKTFVSLTSAKWKMKKYVKLS